MTYIIIVTYNAMPWLQKCLDSCDGYQVAVVDNNSIDGTIDFIKENFPEIHIIPQKENLGFGQANNLGIKHALEQGAHAVFLLNQDVYIQPNCIENLLQIQKAHPEYGVLSPVHFNGRGTQLDDRFLLYLNRYKVNELLLFDAFKAKFRAVYPIAFVNAAAWLVSKACLEEVGGFDPLFFHYGEDRNYCQRVAYYKYEVGIVPTASIFHDRENRGAIELQKYTTAYYQEFERYLKVDWADINLIDFEQKYDARSRYLLSKYKRYLLRLQFKNAKDALHKSKLMDSLKPEISRSRQLNEQGIYAPHLNL